MCIVREDRFGIFCPPVSPPLDLLLLYLSQTLWCQHRYDCQHRHVRDHKEDRHAVQSFFLGIFFFSTPSFFPLGLLFFFLRDRISQQYILRAHE